MATKAQQDPSNDAGPPGGYPRAENENNQRSLGPDVEVHELQSTEQAQLLNAIDGLRQEDIDAVIGIPQVVVCGDQSSGKSSVLEAIARVPFPIDVRTTTRFATEVCLRHATTHSIKVRINASNDRSEEWKAKIENFHPSFELSGRSDFGRLVTEASEHLQALEPEKKFWKDKLHAEISGPDQPHLTLVDLPGIIHNDNNAMAGDKDSIKALVKDYLKASRTVVLAVVNSLVDEDGQEILSLIREVDTASARTIGVITKPDRLDRGSDEERHVISLARNEKSNYYLDRGWHVLRNLSQKQANREFNERDDIEREFFNAEPWTRLPPGDVGIENLRDKLKKALFKAILTGLPGLKREMGQKRVELKATMDRLGPARESIDEQRRYLSNILGKLQRLIESGLQSNYSNTEFATFCGRTSKRALRDHINELTDEFDHKMRLYGHQYHIYTEGVTEGGRVQRMPALQGLLLNHRPIFLPPYTLLSRVAQNAAPNSINVAMKTYCAALSEYMDLTRGEGLRGDISPEARSAVFRQQSVPWTYYAENFGQKCHEVTYDWISAVLLHVCGGHVAEGLQQEFVRQDRDEKYEVLQKTIEHLLWPFKEIRIKTCNPRFRRDIVMPSTVIEGDENATKSFAQLARASNFEPHLVNAAILMDEAETYYEIAVDRFIDNMVTLAIEKCLLHDLPHMIDASNINDQKVSKIASETEEVRGRRKKTQRQIDALDAALLTFRRYSDPTADTHQTATGTTGGAGLAAPRTPVVISGSSSDNPGDTPPEDDNRSRSSVRGASGGHNLAPQRTSGPGPVQQPASGTTSTTNNNPTFGLFGSLATSSAGPNAPTSFMYRATTPSPSPGNRASSAHQAGRASAGGSGANPSGGRSASGSGGLFGGSIFGAGVPAASVNAFGASPSFGAATSPAPTPQQQQQQQQQQ